MDALLEREQSEFPRGGFPRSNRIAVAVAAVCDRRMEIDFGAGRDAPTVQQWALLTLGISKTHQVAPVKGSDFI
jgi:hypothetical protein